MVTETEVAAVLKKTPKAKTPKSPVAKAKSKPVAKKAPVVIHTTSLPKIARAMGIDPKAARAKLRKSHGAAWKALGDDELRALIAA